MNTSDQPICEVCVTQSEAVIPFKTISKSLQHHIHLKTGKVNEFICEDCVNSYKKDFIERILVENIGDLSSDERNIVHNLVQSSILTKDADDGIEEQLSVGDRLADKLADFGGSWKFLIIFFMFLSIWMTANIFFITRQAFDPYPFILLNLILSCIAAIQAPIIMMSQNRQEARDRERAQNDYKINLKAELEIRQLHEKIDLLIKNSVINQEKKSSQ